MKKPDEIKKGLECCISPGLDVCDECPYQGDECNKLENLKDFQAYIRQLEDHIRDLTKMIAKDANVPTSHPKWISVKDRLPPDLEEVLILVKETEFYGQYKEFSKSYFCQYIGCVDDGDWFTVWCHGHRYIKDTAKEPYSDKLEVTHWMPLPEPPKGSE